MVADWERCDQMVNGRYSLTQRHTWYLTGRPGQKEREVRCHFCGNEPPRAQRAAMMSEMLAFEQAESDRRRRMEELKKAMRGPA